MKTKQHLIFGTGLIGSYLAGCFLQSKMDVHLVGRESSKEALKNGFVISDFLDNKYTQTESPQFIEEDKIQTFDFVWLTVKCTSITSIIEPIRAYINESTTIICCQNGFGSEDLIQASFPNNLVLCSVVGFNVAQTQDNHWLRSTDGTLVIEQHDNTKKFERQLASGLLPVRLSSNIQAERWAKLQLNLANSINAIANIPVKNMLENRGYRLIISDMMLELLSVTDRLNLTLPKVSAVHGKSIPTVLRLPNFIFKLLAQKMLAIDPEARTSMSHDINNQRLTEIDFINGAVSQHAQKLGIKTPVNDGVIKLIKSIESGEQKTGFSYEQLQRKLKV